MERKIAGLLGAVATLGAVNAAQAALMPTTAPGDTLRANSFAELLQPIPNATATLKAVDESQPGPSTEGNIQPAQYYHHHYHHHHHWWRRYHHHHHHHHHWYYRY